jgi:hypothetical protein
MQFHVLEKILKPWLLIKIKNKRQFSIQVI